MRPCWSLRAAAIKGVWQYHGYRPSIGSARIGCILLHAAIRSVGKDFLTMSFSLDLTIFWH